MRHNKHEFDTIGVIFKLKISIVYSLSDQHKSNVVQISHFVIVHKFHIVYLSKKFKSQQVQLCRQDLKVAGRIGFVFAH